MREDRWLKPGDFLVTNEPPRRYLLLDLFFFLPPPDDPEALELPLRLLPSALASSPSSARSLSPEGGGVGSRRRVGGEGRAGGDGVAGVASGGGEGEASPPSGDCPASDAEAARSSDAEAAKPSDGRGASDAEAA